MKADAVFARSEDERHNLELGGNSGVKSVERGFGTFDTYRPAAFQERNSGREERGAWSLRLLQRLHYAIAGEAPSGLGYEDGAWKRAEDLRLLAVADDVEPRGRLRLLLVLAWETGRRINAILHLRRSDLLLSSEEVRRALAEEGHDQGQAEHWPVAIRWRAEHDKCGYLSFAPLNRAARGAVEAYLRTHPKIGEAWVFPGNRRPGEPLDELMAGYYLTRAEAEAGLPKLHRGGWHAFRRAWASRRRHKPARDVAEAGGWRSLDALQTAYQHADAQTMRQVVELDEQTPDAPKRAPRARSGTEKAQSKKKPA